MFNFSLSPRPISACPEIIFACVWFIPPCQLRLEGDAQMARLRVFVIHVMHQRGKKNKLKSPELLIAYRVSAPTVPRNVPTVFLADLELTLISGSDIPRSRAFLCFKGFTLTANRVTHVFKAQEYTPSLFLLKTVFPWMLQLLGPCTKARLCLTSLNS